MSMRAAMAARELRRGGAELKQVTAFLVLLHIAGLSWVVEIRIDRDKDTERVLGNNSDELFFTC